MTTNNTNEVFTKRSGTTNKGNKYEDFIIAKLALELAINDDVQAFRLSSNDKKFGSFDDVVVEVFHKHQTPCKYAIQLKYKNESKIVSKDMLGSEEGDFSIQQYFQKFKEIRKKVPEFKLLLYTNRKLDFTTDSYSFYLEEKKYIRIFVNKIKLPVNELLNTSENNYVFQFDIDKNDHSSKEGDDEIDEYKQFFKQFFFYPNQKNVEELQITLSKNFQDTFHCQENFFKIYQDFILNWSQVEGKKHSLAKHTIKFKIAEILLKPFISPTSEISLDLSKYNLFKETCLLYEAVIFRTKDENFIEEMTKLFSQKDIQINKERLEIANSLGIPPTGKKSLDKIEDEEKILILWHINQFPLTIRVTVENKENIRYAINLCLEENELKRKFILIGEDIELDNLKNVKIFQNVNDLPSDSKFLEELIQDNRITLQGREFTTLKTLITNDDEEIKKIITPVNMVKMLNGGLTIGEGKEELPVPYIDQFLLSLQMSAQFLDKSQDNVITVLSYAGTMNREMKKQINAKFISVEDYMKNQDKEELPETVENFVKYGKDNMYFVGPQNIIITTKDECSSEQFQAICKKNPNKLYHHFHLKQNGKLKWVDGNGDFDSLRRTLNFEYLSTSEIIENTDNKINIITSKPGMGKTTLVKYLKNNVSTDYWIIDVNFREHVNYFTEKRDPLDIINYFLHFQFEKQKYDNLTLEFRKIFEKRKKILFLWDGFDELPTMYWKNTLESIKDLVNLDYRNWITTRNNLQRTFEDTFNVFAMTIKNVNEEEQKYYIKKRLKLKCKKKEIDEITDKITENIKTTGDVEFLGIPLHLHILTNLFSADPEKYKEMLNSTFTLPDLIGCSIEETFNFCYKNKGNYDLTQPFLKTVFEEHMQWKMLQYEIIALKTYLPNEVFDKLHISEDFLKYTKLTTDDFGLITRIDLETSTGIFVHNIYGEYFVAKWISKNTELVHLMKKDIFFSQTFNNIRMIFDMLIAKDCPAHLAVLYKNITTLRKFKSECRQKDKMGRNPLHLACSWGERRPILTVEHKDDKHLIDDTDEDIVINDDATEQQKIINFLIKRKCDPFEKDLIFQWNCLEYADASLSLNSLEIMCRNGFQVELKNLQNFKCVYNVLYYSIKFDYKEIFKTVESVPYIEAKHNEENLLHMATFFNRTNYLDKIFENQKYIDEVNKQNCQKIFMFRNQRDCENNTNIVIVVPIKGPFLDAIDVKGIVKNNATISYQIYKQTPVHLASINGNCEAIKALLAKGADINIENNYGNTALHLAIIHDHLNVVKFLIRRGIKTDQQNRNGENELHLAVRTGNLSLIEYLLKQNISIQVNKRGMNPFDYAVILNRVDIINLIFKMEMCSGQKFSVHPFSILLAIASGYLDVAKFLFRNSKFASACPVPLLCCAIYTNQRDIVKFLVENNFVDEIIVLDVAAAVGNINILKLLLQLKTNFINSTNRLGQTALLVSVISYIARNYNDTHEEHISKKDPSIHFGSTLETIEFLLKKGANPNIVDHEGQTPLLVAPFYGNLNAVSSWLTNEDYGLTMCLDNPSTTSYTSKQINDERLNLVKLLLDNHADGNAKNKEGLTCLHLSSQLKYTNICEFLITNRAKYRIDTDIQDNNGCTSLMCAAKKENTEVVDLLIKNGANINAKDNKGLNALLWSSACGYLKISELLLERGACVNSKDIEELTPLHHAAYSGRFVDSSTKTKNDAFAQKFILTSEASENYYKVAKLLIEYKANVNECTDDGKAPLHYAAISGNLKIVELLILEGCDPNKISADGSSALSLSISLGNKSVYEFLLNNKEKYGVNIDQKDNNGDNINLVTAIRSKNIEAVKLLSASGLDLNKINEDGSGILHLVSSHGDTEILQHLLELNVDVNVRDNYGRTPLHYAAHYGKVEAAKILIKNGCIIDAQDFLGRTPLQSVQCSAEMVHLLSSQPRAH